MAVVDDPKRGLRVRHDEVCRERGDHGMHHVPMNFGDEAGHHSEVAPRNYGDLGATVGQHADLPARASVRAQLGLQPQRHLGFITAFVKEGPPVAPSRCNSTLWKEPCGKCYGNHRGRQEATPKRRRLAPSRQGDAGIGSHKGAATGRG